MRLTSTLYQKSFLLLPGVCRLCCMPSARDLELCSDCAQALPRIDRPCNRCGLSCRYANMTTCAKCLLNPPIYEHCIVPYRYAGVVRYLHHRFKFSQDLAAGQLLSELLAEHVARQLVGLEADQAVQVPEVIAPLPTHWWRRLRRGFNQTEVIAKTLAARLRRPVLTAALGRVHQGRAQQGLSAEQRVANVMGAFKVRRRRVGAIRNRSVALVDDVMTTGATAAEAAGALLEAGAKSVVIWCVARATI